MNRIWYLDIFGFCQSKDNAVMIRQCIKQGAIDFFSLISKYMRKHHIEEHNLNLELNSYVFEPSSDVKVWLEVTNQSEWLQILLRLCNNTGIKLEKETITLALKFCKETINDNDMEYKKCCTMLESLM